MGAFTYCVRLTVCVHQCRTANRKMFEAQGFKWEEAFHRYAVGQQLYMHTKWCCEKAHLYVRIRTHSLRQVQHTLMRMQTQQTHSHGLPITLLLEAEQADHVCMYICANAAEDQLDHVH